MSAAAVLYAPAPDARRMPSRPHLVLVPTGPDAPRRRRVRRTRLGRLAVTVVVTGMLIGLALSVVSGSGGAGGARYPVTVAPGQTLSEIAAHELPGVPVSDAVADIQLANNLPSGQVEAGQVLVIPRG